MYMYALCIIVNALVRCCLMFFLCAKYFPSQCKCKDRNMPANFYLQNSITEERLYQQMAMTCSAMAYAWSRWNSDVRDVQKLVVQGCQQLVDEPLLEVRRRP